MAVVITAVAQDVYPPRVLITVTGLTIGDSIELYRVVSSDRTAVRAASADAVSDPSFVRVDAELPYGVPVSYLAVVNGSSEYLTAPTTYVLSGGKPVITDAITGQAAEAYITAWPDKTFERDYTVFKVGGRNIVVSGDFGMYESEVELLLEAGSSVENFKDLLATATGGIVLLRNSRGAVDYLALLRAVERRFSQDITDDRRIYILNVAEVDGWASALEAKSYTLLDISNYYGTGDTLQDIADDFATLLGIAQGDFS